MSFIDVIRARNAAKAAAALAGEESARTVADFTSRFRAAAQAPDPVEHVEGRAAARLMAVRVAKDPAAWEDIRRIVNLPSTFDFDEAETDYFNRENVLAGAYAAGFRLSPKQCRSLASYDETGLFAPMGVGSGKSLIAIMVAARAYKKPHLRDGSPNGKVILLIVTPGTYDAYMNRHIPWARTKVPLNVPFYGMGGKSSANRLAYAKARRKGCYIMPNSLLSSKDTSEFLERLKPDVVILDEAHNCANSSAARTKRLFASKGSGGYVTTHAPEFIPLSGTMTKKSLRDYHHLLKAALHHGMPLPMSSQMATEWAAVIDAGCGEPSSAATGPIKPMVDWARRNNPGEDFAFDTSGIRKAYKYRLRSTPGVVATGDESIGTSLRLTNVPVKDYEQNPGWAKLKEYLDGVNELWVTPDGDELEHAIHTYKWLYELSAGFYNQLLWPAVAALAERRRVREPEAESLLARALEHHEAHQEYARALRTFLAEHAKPQLDTPMLVGRDMHTHGAAHVGDRLYGLWQTMKGLEFEGMPERDSSAVRVCDYKVKAAVEWAKTVPAGRGAVFWVYHQEIGEWVFEELRNAGIDAVHCPAGSDKVISGLGDPELGGKGDRHVVASIAAHGEGKNLQAFQHQYVVQWPRSAVRAEQMLGRLHRQGQEADELVCLTNSTLEFDFVNFAACLNDALYIHATTDSPQKVIYCDYDPLPMMFPPEVLRERGMQNTMLDRAQRRLLEEKFSIAPE